MTLRRSGLPGGLKWDYRGDIREYFNESKVVFLAFKGSRHVK